MSIYARLLNTGVFKSRKMEKWNAEELWDKYQSGKATEEEKAIVERWYNSIDGPAPGHQEQMQAMKMVAAKLPQNRSGRTAIRLWYSIAAAIILVIAVGVYFFHPVDHGAHRQAGQDAADIKPGANNAYLTLSNGKKIVLTDSAGGILPQQPGVKISTATGGQLVYTIESLPSTSSGTSAADYNTLSTPKGGQYQVVLPDGSHVWLNAASSLTYPTTFTGKEREVELKGEAYFEIAKASIKHNGDVDLKPFIVKTAKGEVRVLGTHFNINAYADERDEKTTLLEGSVKVTTGNSASVIKPGEQALLSGASLKVSHVDVDQAVAWKNGIFSFKKADIQTMMRQIARWYDVDVEYEGKIPDDLFVGKIRRDADISAVLRILSLSNVHYRIEGRKIIIKS